MPPTTDDAAGCGGRSATLDAERRERDAREPQTGARVDEGEADDDDADEAEQDRARPARHDDREPGERQQPGRRPDGERRQEHGRR